MPSHAIHATCNCLHRPTKLCWHPTPVPFCFDNFCSTTHSSFLFFFVTTWVLLLHVATAPNRQRHPFPFSKTTASSVFPFPRTTQPHHQPFQQSSTNKHQHSLLRSSQTAAPPSHTITATQQSLVPPSTHKPSSCDASSSSPFVRQHLSSSSSSWPQHYSSLSAIAPCNSSVTGPLYHNNRTFVSFRNITATTILLPCPTQQLSSISNLHAAVLCPCSQLHHRHHLPSHQQQLLHHCPYSATTTNSSSFFMEPPTTPSSSSSGNRTQ